LAGLDEGWEPVSPALVRRINAAIGRWGVGEGDFYKQITEAYACGCEELGNKEAPGQFLAELLAVRELDKIESRFVEILEKVPQVDGLDLTLKRVPPRILFARPGDEPIPGDDRRDVLTTIARFAVWGLMATASCRREIRAGGAAAAAWEMYIATQLDLFIAKVVHDDLNAPILKVFPVKRSWTTEWPNLRDTSRGLGPRGESQDDRKEEAVH
jgi:hypothetical protein